MTMTDHMYINPKWTLHLDPLRPAGPTGKRLFKLLRTQGVNSQALIMFGLVIVSHTVVAVCVGLFVSALVWLWAVLVRTNFAKKIAVYFGVNIADVMPGGLSSEYGGLVIGGGEDGTEFKMRRKNTGDCDEHMLLLAALKSDEEESSRGGGGGGGITVDRDDDGDLVVGEGYGYSDDDEENQAFANWGGGRSGHRRNVL
jgi:hypothetical protein